MRVMARRSWAWSGVLVVAATGAAPGVQPDPPYNRSVLSLDLADEPNPDPTPDKPRLLTGIVHYDSDLADTYVLTCEIAVWINGTYAGGGGTGTGTCGDPGGTQRITVGNGTIMSTNPPIWDCTLFCAVGCTGYDVNICTPPGPSGYPYCFCDQTCIAFRVTGGFGVPIGALDPTDLVEVVLTVVDNGLPEIDTSDDQVSVFAADLSRCDADLNHDGVIDNGDIGAFITLFLQQSPVSDFNADGVVDNGDIGEFIAAFLAGC